MQVAFRRAVAADVPGMMAIVEQGKEYFRRNDIPQWQDGYPNAAMLAEDVEKGEAFVLTADGALAGTSALVFGVEECYARLYEGSWVQSGGLYAVIHRIAVCEDLKGSGLAAALLKGLEDCARTAGLPYMRVDTHRRNIAMQKFLAKHGYSKRGIIYLSPTVRDDENERFAYEKAILPDGMNEMNYPAAETAG